MKLLGLRIRQREPRCFALGNTHIEIFQYLSPKGKHADPNRPACDAGPTHVAFDVVDIVSEYERLKKAGVNFHTELQTVGVFRATYGRDPDGNILSSKRLWTPTTRCP